MEEQKIPNIVKSPIDIANEQLNRWRFISRVFPGDLVKPMQVMTKEFYWREYCEHSEIEFEQKMLKWDWCSVFVHYCFIKAQYEYPVGKINMAARSWTNLGGAAEIRKPGDLVVFKRLGSSWKGHVGFYVGETSKTIAVLGGNQAGTVCYKQYKKKGLILSLDRVINVL